MRLLKKNPLPTFFFIHIPKTGGMSIEKLLRHIYDEKKVVPAYFSRDLLSLKKLKMKRGSLLYGHHPYCISEIFDDDALVFTMLREPLSRTLSVYNHIRRDTTHPSHRMLMAETGSILDFANHETLHLHVRESQTRYLGAQIDFRGIYREHVSGETCREEALKRFMQDFVLPVDEEVYERARRRLYSLPVFGIMEFFSQSCDMLLRYLHRDTPEQYPFINASPQNEGLCIECLSDEEKEELAGSLRYDIKLYQTAKKRFRTLMSDMRISSAAMDQR
jgi:hypothetical protein